MKEDRPQTGVTLNGTFYSIGDEAAWLQWRDFFDDFFHWKKQEPVPPAIVQAEPVTAQVTRKWTPHVPGTRAIDALLLALDASPTGTLLYKEAVAAVEKYGWHVAGASKPILTISVRARQYTHLVNSKKGVYSLTEEGMETVQKIKANAAGTVKENVA